MNLLKYNNNLNPCYVFYIAVIVLSVFVVSCHSSPPNEDYYLRIVGRDTCCLEARMKGEHLMLQWIHTLANWKRPAQFALLDTGFRFYRSEFLPYKQTDSIEAAKAYDVFIAKIHTVNDSWQKISAVLKFVYENAREGDYNTARIDGLPSGKEKFIAYSMDKISTTCAGYADFTAAILNEAGITAGSLTFSSNDSNGNIIGLHTITVALLNNKAYLLDSEMGRYYGLKSQGGAVDYVTMNKLITQGKTDEIVNIEVPHGKGISLNYDYLNQGSCTLDTTLKRYLVKPGIIREDGGVIDVAFTYPERFPLEIDSLFYKKRLPLSYYSFFAFPKSLSGSEEYKKAFLKILDEGGIEL